MLLELDLIVYELGIVDSIDMIFVQARQCLPIYIHFDFTMFLAVVLDRM